MIRRVWTILGLLLLFAAAALGTYYAFFSSELPGEKLKWQEREKKVQVLEAQLQELAGRIQAAQGQSQCESDSECRIVGMGTQMCGKFKNFLVYSVKDTQEASLLALVGEFNRQHEVLSNLSLSSASCGVIPAPVRCVSKHCVPMGNE